MKKFYRLLTQLSSRKRVSRLCGKIAKSKSSKHLIPHFVRLYKINVDEAERQIFEYSSLNSFFTRKMKAGTRPVDHQLDAVVSPVDGQVTAFGKIEASLILNVNSQNYSIEEMLADPHQSEFFKNGQYIILYLSPSDYHRIHSPLQGTIIGQQHNEGTVYPVNPFGMTHMKQVLARNERSITYIQSGRTRVALVKVGAMNVASIQLLKQLDDPLVLKGEEVAYFEFGSTVVLLFEEGSIQFDADVQAGAYVKMGQRIGRLLSAGEDKQGQ